MILVFAAVRRSTRHDNDMLCDAARGVLACGWFEPLRGTDSISQARGGTAGVGTCSVRERATKRKEGSERSS